MKNTKHNILMFLLLSKRFFKKPSFVLLLCVVPVLAVCLRNIAGQDSGMLNIVLCMEDPEDETVRELVEELVNAQSVMRCRLVEDERTARRLVAGGEADAAWIFQKDFLEKIEKMIANRMRGDGPITVVEQEDNVVLQLARIKLFGVMFSPLSYALFQDFAYNDLGVEATDEELRSYYEAFADDNGDLFQLAYSDPEEISGTGTQNYMTAPPRGMLALMIVLGGFAADMFFLQDMERGVLEAFSLKKRRRSVYLYQLAAMVPVAAAVLLALSLLGDFAGIGRELLLMALYLADCMVFCNLVRRACGTSARLGAGLPILILGMLALCPVFFNLRQFRAVQYLLPPYYYLSAAHMGMHVADLAAMLVFAAVGILLNLVLQASGRVFRGGRRAA